MLEDVRCCLGAAIDTYSSFHYFDDKLPAPDPQGTLERDFAQSRLASANMERSFPNIIKSYTQSPRTIASMLDLRIHCYLHTVCSFKVFKSDKRSKLHFLISKNVFAKFLGRLTR